MILSICNHINTYIHNKHMYISINILLCILKYSSEKEYICIYIYIYDNLLYNFILYNIYDISE